MSGSALTAFNYMEHAGIKRAYLLDTFDGFEYDTAYSSADSYWAAPITSLA